MPNSRREFLREAGAAMAGAGIEVASGKNLEGQTYGRPEQYDQLDKIKILEKPTLADIEKTVTEVSQLCKSEAFRGLVDQLRGVISSFEAHNEGSVKVAAAFIEQAKILSSEAKLWELRSKIHSSINDLQGHNTNDDRRLFQLSSSIDQAMLPVTDAITSELKRYNKLVHPEQ